MQAPSRHSVAEYVELRSCALQMSPLRAMLPRLFSPGSPHLPPVMRLAEHPPAADPEPATPLASKSSKAPPGSAETMPEADAAFFEAQQKVRHQFLSLDDMQLCNRLSYGAFDGASMP